MLWLELKDIVRLVSKHSTKPVVLEASVCTKIEYPVKLSSFRAMSASFCYVMNDKFSLQPVFFSPSEPNSRSILY